MAPFAIAGFFILAIACGVGFGVASADSSDDLARAGAFGFNEETHAATLESASGDDSVRPDSVVFDQQVLATASSRDISAGLTMVDELEAAEKARIEAENAAAIERMQTEKAMQGMATAPVAASDSDSDQASQAADDSASADATPAAESAAPVEETIEYNLPAVDWSCGRDAFIEEWTVRIDAYLAGSPLEGYGNVFAEAAWDNGVDPRWSPAIANTESSKGAVCFLSHNAWGWGSTGWSDWDTAIRDHVAGLASVYGYSITPEAAATYCPPNHAHWYATTVQQMACI